MLFPFSEYWSFYLAFTVFVLGLLSLDLGVFHKNNHEVSFKESLIWTIVWVSLALIFNVGFGYYASQKFGSEIGSQVSLEFLTGFIIEKALAIDNLFVFILIFSYFKIPKYLQHKILFFGILGALVFRAIFIALGSILMQYQWVVILFGIFLLITGVKMLFTDEEGDDLELNPTMKFLRKFIPSTSKLHGDKFFIYENGKD